MAPKAVAALILAIASCEGGLAYGVPGIVLGVIARNLSRRARAAFDADPLRYRGENIIRAAEKWSRIGLIQGIVLTVVWAAIWTLYFVAIFSFAFRH
jgi:hypothetical protein